MLKPLTNTHPILVLYFQTIIISTKVYRYTHKNIYTHIYIYKQIHMYDIDRCTHIYIFTYQSIYTQINIYIYTHIHIYTHQFHLISNWISSNRQGLILISLRNPGTVVASSVATISLGWTYGNPLPGSPSHPMPCCGGKMGWWCRWAAPSKMNDDKKTLGTYTY